MKSQKSKSLAERLSAIAKRNAAKRNKQRKIEEAKEKAKEEEALNNLKRRIRRKHANPLFKEILEMIKEAAREGHDGILIDFEFFKIEESDDHKEHRGICINEVEKKLNAKGFETKREHYEFWDEHANMADQYGHEEGWNLVISW